MEVQILLPAPILEIRMPLRYDFSKMYWNEKVTAGMKWPEDYEKFFASFGLPGDTLIHVGHCTLDCGCKYDDDDCPIVVGTVKPIFKGDFYDLELIDS